jgi:hypothetical protein
MSTAPARPRSTSARVIGLLGAAAVLAYAVFAALQIQVLNPLATVPGSTLADTFFVGGADHSPWALVLHLTSLVAVLALVAVAIVRTVGAAVDSVCPATDPR